MLFKAMVKGCVNDVGVTANSEAEARKALESQGKEVVTIWCVRPASGVHDSIKRNRRGGVKRWNDRV